MRFLSWNIQWGRGADGRIDLARTIEVLKNMPDLDAICLQEVAQNVAGLPGGDCGDQVAELSAAFPDWAVFFAPGLDVPDGRGGRAAFGNLLMTRLPVGQVCRHILPMPADATVPGMRRSCIEVVIDGPVAMRLMTTHLEYYSARQRTAQIQAIQAIHAEAVEQSLTAACTKKDGSPMFAPRARPAAAVLCGDLNFEPDSDSYRSMTSQGGLPEYTWRDAWIETYPKQPHPPTVGLHDAGWPGRQYCCDYFWLAALPVGCVSDLRVMSEADASDHQPIVLDLVL